MSFEHAWLLYFLWLVPATGAGWFAMHRRHEKALARFLSPVMQRKLRPASRHGLLAGQAALVTAGVYLLLVAAARPQWGAREEVVFQRGRDLLIALDVSRSMLARDVHPNRLERAKTDILDLVREFRGDRAGLIAFRRKARLLCPLTTDYAYLQYALNAVSIDSAPRGQTDIGAAIETALEAFESETGSHKAIVLVSDGEDLSGRVVEAAKRAAARNIPIFTVGLGSTRGAPVPDEDARATTYQGKEVMTRLENETLHRIAEITRGAYVPIGTASTTTTTLGTIYRKHLQRIADREHEETLQRRMIDRYQWFLLPGLLLLIAGALLSRGRLKTGKPPVPAADAPAAPEPAGTPPRDITPPRRPPRSLTGAALLFLSVLAVNAVTNDAPASATNALPAAEAVPSGRAGARRAQRLYRRGRYEEAAAAYLAAARDAAQRPAATYRYNAAVAHFQAGRYREALDLLRELMLEGEPDRAYNAAAALGAAAYRTAAKVGEEKADDIENRAALFKEAGDAFREAARNLPDDPGAARNLAVLQNRIPAAAEKARIARLLEKHRQTPASQLAAEMLESQRTVTEAIPGAFTNTTPERIALLEDLAAKQRAASDLWVPLKKKLLEAMAAQQGDSGQQLAAVSELTERTREQMRGAADALRDLDPAGYGPAVTSQHAVYGLWKGIAAFPDILKEDLYRQSNALTATVAGKFEAGPHQPGPKDNQKEAGNLTRLFVDRFSAAVPEAPTNAPTADPAPSVNTATNESAISPETRRKILELADEAEATQAKALALLDPPDAGPAAEHQKRAYELLEEIEKLLPKQQQKQDNRQQQNDPNEDHQQQQDNRQPEQNQEQPRSEQEQPDPEEEVPRDVQELLDKALQREKEHEEEKRRRRRFIPLPTLEKDW